MYQLDPLKMALLTAISGKESAGNYDVGYGGTKITDFSRHPGQSLAKRITSGPNAGKTSSAAGRYQFIEPTWLEYSKRAGVPDFSPASQDKVAWELAATEYKRITGKDLEGELTKNDPAAIGAIGRALSQKWTSLPGGIEQTQSESQFANNFREALKGASPYETQLTKFSSNPMLSGSAGTVTPTEIPQAGEIPAPISRPFERETPEQRQARLEAALKAWKEQQDYMRQNTLPPGFGSMGQAQAGFAGLSNPGYQDASVYAEPSMMNLMQLLISGKFGSQQEYMPFM